MGSNQEKLLHFQIKSIRNETSQARTYELEPLDGTKPSYKPGQFLTIVIRTEQQELRRSYSILTLPEEPLRITVKKVDNGAISRYILQHWQAGTEVLTLPPSGRFSLSPRPGLQRDIFCFAAGSGIIPILPQIRRLLKEEDESAIHLVYSNHNEESTLFLHDVEVLANQYSNFRLKLLFSDPKLRMKEQGHLSNLYLESYVNNELSHRKKDAVFLVCGPFTYMRMIQIMLGFLHFSKDQILKENYIPELMRAGVAHHPVFPDTEVLINNHGDSRKIKVPSGKDILSAAIEQGLPLPYSCRGGICGNCALLCKRGRVEMSINEVLTDQDIRQGWVLACTGFPAEQNTILEVSPQL